MHWITRTALELIFQGGLGYSIDSLGDDSDLHPYSVAAKQLTYVTFFSFMRGVITLLRSPVMFTMIFFRNYLLTTFVKLGPPRFRRFLVDLLPFKNARRLRDIIDIIHNTSVEILEAKRRALKEGDEAVAKQIGRGKDIISILSEFFQLKPRSVPRTHHQSGQ
jgi:hypothetical protein